MKKYTTVLALAVCALAMVALGSANNPVTRPCRGSGHVEGTITGVNGSLVSLEAIDIGEATHLGQYFNEASYVLDLSTGQVTGSGVATAANGDTIDWVIASGPGPNQFRVTWTGGTGRFANASGAVVGTEFNIVQIGMTRSFDYTIEGTITY